MAEKQSNKDRIKEITAGIEQGIKELFESDKYRNYLVTMSRFHRYSVNNVMLIHMQRPDATLVAGFNKWRDQFGRNVKRGEKGIKIIAPAPYKKKIEEMKLDPDTKAPVLDKDGNAIIEEKEIHIPTFKVATVFDVSQTEGKPLPQLASDLTGNVQQYEIFMEALRRTSPVPIEFKHIAPDTDGFLSLADQSITIREGMSEVQTVCAAIHEIAHAKLHNTGTPIPDNAPVYQEVEIFDIPALFSNGRIAAADIPEGLFRYDLRGSDDDPGMPIAVEENVLVNHAGSVLTAKPIPLPEEGRLMFTEDEGLNFVGGEITAYQFREEQKKDRETEEVEAESISYTVCQYYGIETSENSFGYVANWSKDKDLKVLRESLETINKTSSALITDIGRHFDAICKERGIDRTAETVSEPAPTAEEPEQSAPVLREEALYLVDDTVYLHVQPTDGGYGYTLYDKESGKLMDGGVIDNADIEASPVSSLLGAVRTEVFVAQGMTPTKVTAEDIALVEQLQAAQTEVTAEPMLPETPEQAMDEPLPDPTLTVSMMEHYGYTDHDMLPLSKDRAMELMERDITVYVLYDDNTEAMVFETEDILKHDGMFGITREDWEAVKADVPLRDVEQRFLNSPTDSMAIYQLRRDAPVELRFTGLDSLKAAPDPANYEAVYTREVYPDENTSRILENFYFIFNEERPGDFVGHSLSVSDIVALKQDDKVSYERKNNEANPQDLLQYHDAVKSALGYAVEIGWLNRNPAEQVNPCTDEAPILFTDFILEWLEMMKNKVELTTYAAYASGINSSIVPYFIDKKYTLQDIEKHPKYIQDYYQSMLNSGLTANTVIHRHANIRKCLQYAFQIGLIKSNPADRIERPRKEKYVAEVYNQQELEKLFEAVKGDPLELGVILASFYGLRRSEVVGLKWDAIDFERKTISIKHTVTQVRLDGKSVVVAKDRTKTKSSHRTLPLVEPFERLLVRLWREQQTNQQVCGEAYCKDYTDYIYVNSIGERIKPNYITQHFEIVLNNNNLKRIRYHDLRHSCASLLYANGVSLKEIQEWLGHSDIGTTSNIYTHLDYSSKVSSANAILPFYPTNAKTLPMGQQ